MFKSLSLYVRILLGFAMITILLVLIAILSVSVLNSSLDKFDNYSGTVGVLGVATDIEKDVLTTMLLSGEYLESNSQESVSEFSATIKKVKDNISQLNDITDNREIINKGKSILENINYFENTFNEVIALTNNQQTIINDFIVPMGDEIEENLSGLMNDAFGNGDTLASFGSGQAVRNILRSRNAIFKLLNTRNLDLTENISDELDLSEESIAFLDQMITNLTMRHYVDDTKKGFALLKDNYIQLENSMRERENKVDEFSNLQLIIFKNTADLRESVTKIQLEVGKEVEDQNNSIKLVVILLMIGSVVLSLIVSFVVARSIIRPIKKLEESIKEFGKGDFTIDFSMTGKNEVVRMANILHEMASSLRQSISSISEAVDQINGSSENLNVIAQESNENSELLSNESGLIEDSILNTTSSLEETNAGIEEIANSSQNVAKVAQELANDTDNAELKTKDGNKIVSDMLLSMKDVSDQSRETTAIVSKLSGNAKNVGEIVETISSIAEQTNLLALNAAIEAARAGEAGKGFAVVADEIRKLAEESRKATETIDSILKEIQKGTTLVQKASEKNVGYVDSLTENAKHVDNAFSVILESIEHISNSVEDLAGSAQEQSASTMEITRAVEVSTNSMNSISEKIKVLSDSAEKQASNSENISSLVAELYAMAESLEEQIKHFKY